MTFLGLHWLDWSVLAAYFAAVIYLGVFLGGKKTKNLGDFFVAGGKWGALVSFIFVFASALAGNEAVAVSTEAYRSGLSGFWIWGNFLFATPIYFLFATYYRRARVYNLAEFLEMRYGSGVAAVYSLVAGVICVLFIGMFLLAVAQILAGCLGLDVERARGPLIWTICAFVAAYVFSGGMMSTLLTDLLQGIMCLVILGFVFLPFLWVETGGLDALRKLPPETWSFTGPGMELPRVTALCLSTIVGGIAAPWIYSWIAVSKNEQAATQCAWAHLWKRIATLMFTLYGIFFAILLPSLNNPDLAWGTAMKQVLPEGLMGLMIASFFAAAMSSTATYATTSAAMLIDYGYRKIIQPGRPRHEYLTAARWWTALAIVIAAGSTHFVADIKGYIDLCLQLLCFLGIPIYFGIVWRKSNRTGMWLSLILGILSFIVFRLLPVGEEHFLKSQHDPFVFGIFVATGLSLAGMILGTLFGPDEDSTQLKRFYTIMNTPIGQEHRLLEAGIRLPSLVDAGLVPEGPEELQVDRLNELYRADSHQKIFGPESSIELRRERLPWYLPGFLYVTASCVLLVVFTWLFTRILFVWK